MKLTIVVINVVCLSFSSYFFYYLSIQMPAIPQSEGDIRLAFHQFVEKHGKPYQDEKIGRTVDLIVSLFHIKLQRTKRIYGVSCVFN